MEVVSHVSIKQIQKWSSDVQIRRPASYDMDMVILPGSIRVHHKEGPNIGASYPDPIAKASFCGMPKRKSSTRLDSDDKLHTKKKTNWRPSRSSLRLPLPSQILYALFHDSQKYNKQQPMPDSIETAQHFIFVYVLTISTLLHSLKSSQYPDFLLL